MLWFQGYSLNRFGNIIDFIKRLNEIYIYRAQLRSQFVINKYVRFSNIETNKKSIKSINLKFNRKHNFKTFHI